MSGNERFVVEYQDMNRVRAEAAEEGWTEGENLFDYVDKIVAGLRYKKADDLQDAIEKARRLHEEEHVEDYPIIRRQIVESEVDVGAGVIMSVPPEWVTADIWYLTEDGVEKG
jgi:hypothetical protein